MSVLVSAFVSLSLSLLVSTCLLSAGVTESFDFAVAQLPGWHTTIFPPYFVAGAIFSGFAMVMTLAIPKHHDPLPVWNWMDLAPKHHNRLEVD